jgi:hypothetical protein
LKEVTQFKVAKKYHEEEHMKRFIVFAVAALLALPVVSFAGSATSRWDVTIGGYIKFDMGYADQSQGADYRTASRGSYGSYDNEADEYGNFFSAAGETRFNFLIKGPDGWGAKTLGFIEGEFRGTTGGSNYGTFALRHAFMKMQWENDTLTIGHTWQKWGYIPTYSNILLGVNMLTAFQRGSRQPQIMWDHTFNKNFNMSLGIISPTNAYGTAGGANVVNSFTKSPYPFLEGEVSYTSDACGKIGPWQMLFSLSGFYGWDRQVYNTSTTTDAVTYDDKLETAWGAAFKAFIPIIPEKKGDKGGALSVSGILFASQNPGWYMGPLAVGAYNTGTTAAPDYKYPRIFGGWGQVTYFLTDKLFVSGWYGSMYYNMSDRYRTVSAVANQVQKETQYIFNVSYDVNPAMRLGIEYDYISTRYAGYGALVGGEPSADKSGKLSAIRIGAWYFF